MQSSAIAFAAGFTVAMLAAAASGDIITGKVTDLATKAPLAGVKVTGGRAAAVTAADGTYSLNTEEVSTGLPPEARMAEIAWDGPASAFRWDPRHGNVSLEVRDMRGALVDRFDSRAAGASEYRFKPWASGLLVVSVSSPAGAYRFRMHRVGSLAMLLKAEDAPGRSGIHALVKVAATTKVAFNHTGYDVYSQYVIGNKAGFDVALHKSGSLAWRKARLTWYESYPDPNSEECIKYNGCTWAGQFAALGKKPKEWVAANNLVAVHSKDYNAYKLKTLRLKHKDFLIDAQVVDMCSDSDCGGCCTQNANTGGGFLIDLEIHGTRRFGLDDGSIEWTCLNC